MGKVVRIDVDSEPDPNLQYKIPADNPFVNETGTRGEIYAYGIRNIWRCDVDEGDPVTGSKCAPFLLETLISNIHTK